MMFFEAAAKPLENLNGVADRGLDHIHLLEAACQCTILLENAAELLKGGGSYAADLTRGQQWLEQIGRVHDTAGGRAGANDGMDFVDEQDRLGTFLQRLEQRLEALLEVPAVLGTGQQCAEIQRVHHGLGQYVGYLAIHDTLGQTFGNGCLADTSLTRSEEHTSELQSRPHLVCRLLL